jgi:diphosphomevalonate decarboxylase
MPSFEPKIDEFLNALKNELPFLNYLSILIESRNTFPHSAGIASSASAISSIALCFAEIEAKFYGNPIDHPDFFRRASYLARIGSGSAARSVFGNFVAWGQTKLVPDSSDLYAVELKSEIHPFFKRLQNYILVTDSSTKSLSSSSGHEAMKNHPYASGRLLQANNNFSQILEVLQSGDWDSFISIVENEALSLNALLLSSSPGYILLKPETLSLIQEIRRFRKESGLFLCFSLDAGPNIHLLFHENDKSEIDAFTNSELRYYCEKANVIKDLAGDGPERIINND